MYYYILTIKYWFFINIKKNRTRQERNTTSLILNCKYDEGLNWDIG